MDPFTLAVLTGVFGGAVGFAVGAILRPFSNSTATTASKKHAPPAVLKPKLSARRLEDPSLSANGKAIAYRKFLELSTRDGKKYSLPSNPRTLEEVSELVRVLREIQGPTENRSSQGSEVATEK